MCLSFSVIRLQRGRGLTGASSPREALLGFGLFLLQILFTGSSTMLFRFPLADSVGSQYMINITINSFLMDVQSICSVNVSQYFYALWFLPNYSIDLILSIDWNFKKTCIGRPLVAKKCINVFSPPHPLDLSGQLNICKCFFDTFWDYAIKINQHWTRTHKRH